MDFVGLITLRQELADDCRVARDPAVRLSGFLAGSQPGALEATAFEIARFYNVIEQASLRVARSFENHFEKNSGWHEALLKRMSLEIPGVRPALFSPEFKRALDAIRRFRHLVHHAYDLELQRERVEEVAGIVTRVARELEGVWEHFIQGVAEANHWKLPG